MSIHATIPLSEIEENKGPCPAKSDDIKLMSTNACGSFHKSVECDDSIGYHVNHIERGELGELSKIREELDEAEDAQCQGCNLMLLLELSDVIGAIEFYLEKHHPTISLDDLVEMASVTRRAFEIGER